MRPIYPGFMASALQRRAAVRHASAYRMSLGTESTPSRLRPQLATVTYRART